MAAAAPIELAVVEAVEATTEAAAEQTTEALVEESVQQIVEQEVQAVVETDVQAVIETGVQDAVVEASVEASENAAEQGVVQAVEQGQAGVWRQMFWDKIFPAMIAGISAGLVIEIVERSIDAATGKYDKKKDSTDGRSQCTQPLPRNTALFTQRTASAAARTDVDAAPKTTKDKLLASKKLLVELKRVAARWEVELQKYKKKNDAFGSFKLNTKHENANTTVAILFTSMYSDLKEAGALAEKSNKKNSWDETITEFQWYLIDAVSRLLAVYKVKAASKNMQDLDFPVEKDESVLQSELERDFPNYKSIVKQMVVKHLKSATGSHAKTASQTAVEKIVKPALQKEITKVFNATIRPSALAEGKKAAKAEVIVVFNEWAKRINYHAAIPIYGISTLKSWMKQNIEPEAKRRAEEKAIAAARATIELPDAQIQMMKISKAAKEKVLKDYKEEIDKAVSDAAKEAIEKAMKQHSS